jgi:signal transduction histidine kinase
MLLPRLLLTMLVWWLAVAAAPARAGQDCDQVQLLDQAMRTVTQDGRVIDERGVQRMDTLLREWRNERTHISYRIYLDSCPGMRNRSLWIYRVGAPYRAWLDGRPLIAIDPAALVGRHAAQVYNGRVPALFMLPPEARRLDIELVTVPYMGNGLVRLATGPQEAMLEMRVVNSGVIARLYDLANYVVGIIGLLALLIWRMRMRDRTVLWFGLACVTWAVRGWAYQVFVYPLPALVMEQLNPLLVLTTLCCVTASILHSVGQASVQRLRWLGYAWLLPTFGMVAAALLGTGSVPMRLVSFATAFFLICYALVRVAQSWRLNRKIGHALMGAGLFVLIAGSLHDLGLVFGWVPPDRWVLITPAFTVLLLAHTVAVSIYLGQSLNRAELANDELERNIAAKSRELEHSYALLRESERASARAQERARFNREIHDGLGAQLITALRGVERGALDKHQVAQTLQEGLDELRLLMDSSDLGQTLHEALVAWRNRWDPRLQAVDLALHWSVDPTLDGLELGTDATLQVMRVLQEAVTNAVKHAGAQSVAVRAWLNQDVANNALVLEVRDDGHGIGTVAEGHLGRGLGNMRQRAERLGAELVVNNAPPPLRGTVVRLTLKLREGDFPHSEPVPLPL